MRLQVKGKNVEVTPSIREYAERKLAKLGKQLAEQTQVEVELSEQRNPSIAASHVAEATIFTKGPTLRAREASPDMKASIDQLVDEARAPGEALPRTAARRAAPARRAPRRHGRRGPARLGLFRRRKPLHGGWPSAGGRAARLGEPSARAGQAAEPPGWDGEPRGEPGIHGVPRPRRWDAVATAEAPGCTATPCTSSRCPTGRSSSKRTSPTTR